MEFGTWNTPPHTDQSIHIPLHTQRTASPVGPLSRLTRGGGAGGDLFLGAAPFRRPDEAPRRITRTNVTRFENLQIHNWGQASHIKWTYPSVHCPFLLCAVQDILNSCPGEKVGPCLY